MSMQSRPRMLKDFLQDDTNSCSRYQVNKVKPQSAFQAMVNALVRNIPFSAVTAPSILPRSLSRKLSKKHGSRNSKTDGGEGQMEIITVTVKDIMRWKSFRDLAEEKPQPLDLSLTSSPLRCITTTTTTTTSCSSRQSSWCDSDFTAEYLSDEEEGKKNSPCVGGSYLDTTTETQGYNSKVYYDEEEQQHSPHSVLDYETSDVEEPFPHFRESVEKEWGLLGHTKELCVREMEEGGRWSKFDEDQQDLCLEIERGLFVSLIDEVLRDLIS